MMENGIKRLPIVDADGTLVGIVTRSDLVRAFARTDAEIEREIREEIVTRTLWIDDKKARHPRRARGRDALRSARAPIGRRAPASVRRAGSGSGLGHLDAHLGLGRPKGARAERPARADPSPPDLSGLRPARYSTAAAGGRDRRATPLASAACATAAATAGATRWSKTLGIT